MNDQPSHENTAYPEIDYVVKETPRRHSPLRRLGCGALLLGWFAILLLPLAMFVLAIQGDVTIWHGAGIPDREEHPRLQVRLIMEMDFRGLGITNSSIEREGDNLLCIQSDVRFLLWQGEGEPATFCDCYTRSAPDSAWALESTVTGGCD
ncbi:hypothetical protein HC928_05120 [bacterium]|nr:hypothetical protein [bacterium]